MKLRNIIESDEDEDDWGSADHDCEQAYYKYEVLSLPSGFVGYKFSDSMLEVGSSTMPKYVVAMDENSNIVDYSDVGNFQSDYLIKVRIPVLPGRKTTHDINVMEWYSQCTYFAGNPLVQATSERIKNGDEVLILTDTEVLDIYKWDLDSDGLNGYVNHDGHTLKIVS